MKDTIISIGFVIPAHDELCKEYRSEESLLDADIILFEPDFDDYDEESYYRGKSLISKTDSFKLVEETTHWKKKLSITLEHGKTVFVFFTAYEEFYIHVSEGFDDKNIYDNYRFLPVQLPPIIPRAGKVIKSL